MVKRPLYLFLITMLVYGLTRYLRQRWQLPVFFEFYFTDLLFVPAMCLFSLVFLRLLKRNPSLTIPWHYVLFQTLLISLYFEWYLPVTCTNAPCYVSDMSDVICYFTGAGLFLLLQNSFLTNRKTMENN